MFAVMFSHQWRVQTVTASLNLSPMIISPIPNRNVFPEKKKKTATKIQNLKVR
jgi:hypothetical protein